MQTHRSISDAIITLAGDSVPIIGKASFRLGCNMTDLFWTSPDHTKAESFLFLSKLIKELQQSKPGNVTLQVKLRLFVKLGIVCHYICDYFCKAHNHPYYNNNLLPHLIYENELRTEFNAHNLNNLCNKALIKMESAFDTQTSIPDYIQGRHLAYLSEKPSMKKDIFFAVDTSTTVMAALLSQIQARRRYHTV